MDIEEFYNILDVMHITFGDLTKAKIFLLVCQQEGISQVEIATRLRLPQPSVSRHVLALTKRLVVEKDTTALSYKEVGLGFCKCLPDPYEPRRLAVFLTEQGKRFLEDLKQYLSGGE